MWNALELVGLAILAGFGVGSVCRFLRVPAVAGYVVIGVILGQSVTDLFPDAMLDRLGVVSDLALGVIAFTIALTLYGVAAALAKALFAKDALFSMTQVMAAAGYEIGGALVVGALAGAAVAPWVKRLGSREAVFTLTVGALVSIVGLSQQFGISSLLANMACGVVLVNAAPISSRKAFDQMAVASAPLFIAFFVLAGAHLRLDLLPSLGLLGAVYLLARIIGKVGGAALGGAIARAPRAVRSNIGFGLLSQVGIAIGLSLVVAKEFAPYGEAGRTLAVTVINILLATTVITEIVGPMLTRYALIRSGEAGKQGQDPE